jgi:single-stranded DNA-binding protein
MKNEVKLLGVISSDFTYSHTLYSEGFYTMTVSVKRGSDKVDLIPVMVSDRLLDVRQNYINERVILTGQFRSYNQREELKTTLKLYVFVTEISFTDEQKDINDAFLEGYLCKTPTYRHTPLGREISDLMVAVNRAYGKSDYIPCICWGRSAYYARGLEAGNGIRIAGRIQSREYVKNGETKTAYELSVNLIELC